LSTTSPRTPVEPEAAAGRWRLRHLPPLLLVSGLVAAGAAVVGGLVSGGVGAFAAALGVAVATASFVASTLVIAWADTIDTKLVMPFGMGTYIAKVCVLVGLLLVLVPSGWAGLQPFAWGLAVGVVAWSAAQIWWIVTVHVPATRRTGPDS
jgi:hypothetical protein